MEYCSLLSSFLYKYDYLPFFLWLPKALLQTCASWEASPTCLWRPFLRAGVQLKVLNADGGDDMALTPRVARAVGEDDLVVALAAPQQTEVLQEKRVTWVHHSTESCDSKDQGVCKYLFKSAKQLRFRQVRELSFWRSHHSRAQFPVCCVTRREGKVGRLVRERSGWCKSHQASAGRWSSVCQCVNGVKGLTMDIFFCSASFSSWYDFCSALTKPLLTSSVACAYRRC